MISQVNLACSRTIVLIREAKKREIDEVVLAEVDITMISNMDV